MTGKNKLKKRRNLHLSLNIKTNNLENVNKNINNSNKEENEIVMNHKDENSEDSEMKNSNLIHEDLMNIENKNEEISTSKLNININQIPKEVKNNIDMIKDENKNKIIEKKEEQKIEIPEHLKKEYKILNEIIISKDKNKFEQFLNFKKYFHPKPNSEEIDKKAEILKQVLRENMYLKNSISSNNEESLELNKENGILESKLEEINWTIGHLNEVLSEQKIKTMELKDKLGEFDNSNNNLFISNQGLV